jgi:acyl carrier protein
MLTSDTGDGSVLQMPLLPPGIDAEEVAGILTAFVNANVMARGRPIRPDDDFESAGVDSMGLLKVLLFVEAEFGLWVPDEDLVEANVTSPRAIANYLCRRRGLS